VRFNADTDPNLPWEFKPVQATMEVLSGEKQMAYYEATNLSDEPITGTAVYNVTPNESGEYFNKIDCFCFQEQTLQPGETAKLPITFFVDPEMETDPATQKIRTVTLSYTFFRK